MSEAVAALEVHDLTVAYQQTPVVWDVDLVVPAGVMLAIVGPNGAGKTTLLKAILGLLKPVTGRVTVLGKPFRENRQAIAYVPQRGSVDWDFPTTVFDLVQMGTYGRLGWFRRPGRTERDATHSALDQVGLVPFANRQIGELSGGQQQRAFLARALVQDAPITVLDEPFQGIDALTERAIVEVLHNLRDQGRTVVAVHHDLQTVTEYFNYLALLNVSLIALGPTSEIATQENFDRAYGRRTPAIRTGQPIAPV